MTPEEEQANADAREFMGHVAWISAIRGFPLGFQRTEDKKVHIAAIVGSTAVVGENENLLLAIRQVKEEIDKIL